MFDSREDGQVPLSRDEALGPERDISDIVAFLRTLTDGFDPLTHTAAANRP